METKRDHGPPPTRRRNRWRRLAWCAALGSSLAGARGARADEPSFGAHDVPTLFYIAKSDDRNRVDYGMRLDDRCAARQDLPVFPYWREFERSPPVRVHPLVGFEFMVYGIQRQGSTGRSRAGYHHVFRLRQLQRDLHVVTRRTGHGGCAATVTTHIAGRRDVQVLSAFVQLGPLASVKWVDLLGRDPESGEDVTERLLPDSQR